VSAFLWTLRRYGEPVARIAAAVLGLVLAVLGAILLFSTDNSAGALFVIGLAATCVLFAVFASRIRVQSFGVLGAQIAVSDVVRKRLEVARPPDAAATQAQAQTLRKLGELYELYAFMRRTQPPGNRRTSELDRLARRVQEEARDVPFDPVEVATWFHEGTDALRFVALNVMIAREDCRDFMAVLEGVESSRSAFEQFYALRLARKMLPKLDRVQRGVLAATLERALRRRRRMKGDTARKNLASVMLSELRPATRSQETARAAWWRRVLPRR
jgi:hypothetical protein